MNVLEQYHQTEVYCIELIIEFFICHNFQNTLSAFKEDVKQSQFPLPDPFPKAKERIKKDHVPLLLKLLDNYDHMEFFEKWTSLVPDEIRCLTEYKKLTIYLYTYFATIKYRNKSWNDWENQSNLYSSQGTSNLNNSDSAIVSDESSFIQKVEETNKTFIIQKPVDEVLLPIVEPEENSSFKQHEFSVNEESKFEDEDSSNREFEADSLENESDSNENESTEQTHKPNSEYSAMEMFKVFLSENGSEFTNDPEFLPFFALPFVENPRLHPAFTKVFEENWLNDLKQTLQRFLINYSCGDAVIPKLVKICSKNESSFNNSKEELSVSVVDESAKRLKEVKRKFHRLKKDHQKLVGVASELSSALEKSVQGEAVNLKSTLSNCIKIFPDLFSVEVPANQQIKVI